MKRLIVCILLTTVFAVVTFANTTYRFDNLESYFANKDVGYFMYPTYFIWTNISSGSLSLPVYKPQNWDSRPAMLAGAVYDGRGNVRTEQVLVFKQPQGNNSWDIWMCYINMYAFSYVWEKLTDEPIPNINFDKTDFNTCNIECCLFIACDIENSSNFNLLRFFYYPFIHNP